MKEQSLEGLVGKYVFICTARGTDAEESVSGEVEKVFEAEDKEPAVILLKDHWDGIPVTQEVEITEL